MRILLFGRNGQVGWELQRSVAPLGEVISLGREARGPLRGDFLDLAGLRETVRSVRPDVIVNAAAYTDVDLAESRRDEARIVNAEAPALLASEARELGALLVHYSTEYVFSGEGSRPWREDDCMRPLNVYGRAKLDGDRAIEASGCRYLIFRTSWVYAARGKNFLRTILRLAKHREVLRVVDDQVGAPTAAELVADVTAQVLRALFDDPRRAGTYHLAPKGETSWYEYARFALDRAMAAGWRLKATPERVEPISSEAFGGVAERPRNSRLDCALLARVFGLDLPDWRFGVERAVEEMRESLDGGLV